jgi:hypothetical protein
MSEGCGLLLSLTVIALAAARIVFADESGSPADLQRLRRRSNSCKAMRLHNAAAWTRMNS